MPKSSEISRVSSLQSAKPGEEILIECTQIGASMRVTAMDVATMTEIVFQAPVHASQDTIEKIAKAKILYVLEKKK